jgi:hypothetical protein
VLGKAGSSISVFEISKCSRNLVLRADGLSYVPFLECGVSKASDFNKNRHPYNNGAIVGTQGSDQKSVVKLNTLLIKKHNRTVHTSTTQNTE